MENMELFDKHLSGNLSESEATELFSKLAIDENLRSEFNAFASVKSGIQKNINSFAPSSALKSTVFANAGFSGSSVSAVTNSANAGLWGSKILTGVVSAVSGAIVTVLLLKTLGVSFDENETLQYADSEKFEYPEYVVEMPVNLRNEKKESEIIYIDRFIPVEVDNKKSNKRYNTIESSEINSKNYSMLNSKSISEFILQDENYNPLEISSDNRKLNIEVMGMTGWNVPDANIYPNKYSKLNNLNVNLLYELNDKFKAGIGFSQETFHTVYEGTEADGSIFKYFQQPNISTFSLVAKYIPFEYNSVAPFLQAGIGFNQSGYLINPSVGAEFRLYPELSFIVGLDYKLLGYTHQNKLFNAEKYALRYGFSFNF